MNRLEMRNRVRYFIDEPTQQNFSDADINAALNNAQLQVQLEIVRANPTYLVSATPTTISLVPGTAAYALHADVNGECDVLNITRVEMKDSGLPVEPMDQNEKALAGTGLVPLGVTSGYGFYLLGNSITFDPVPQQTATVYYWFNQLLADLANDTDRCQLPRGLHDMVPVRAAKDSFIKDEADTSQLDRLWNEYMDRLRRTVGTRQTMAPRHVQRTYDEDC